MKTLTDKQKLNAIKKNIDVMINEALTENWKDFKRILKDEKGYKNKLELLRDSYDFGCYDEYDSLNWSAGYISGLKAVLNIINDVKQS